MNQKYPLYLLQNQDKFLLSKENGWTDGRDITGLYRTPHKDEALNQLVEVNSKDISQRIQLLECDIDKQGQPCIEPNDLPPPLPKETKLEADQSDDTEQESTELAVAEPG